MISLQVEPDILVVDVKRRLHAQNADYIVNLQRLEVVLDNGGRTILQNDRPIGSYCATEAIFELSMSGGFHGGTFVRSISSRIVDPWGVCVSPDGETLFVSSQTNHCIHVLNVLDGSHIRTIGTQGKEDGQLNCPTGICLSNDGKRIFVTDNANHRVQALLVSDGSHIFTIGQRGFGPGQFFNFPTAVRLSPDEQLLLVCDMYNHRVQVISGSDGSVRTIGSRGSESEQLSEPSDVCISPDGEYCFVADRKNHRVQIYRVSDGTHTRSIPVSGRGTDTFHSPVGVGLSPCGQWLFVTVSKSRTVSVDKDGCDHQVQVFRTSDCEHMHTIGLGERENPGLFPSNVCVSPSGELLFVVDQENNRVQVFTA